MITTTAKLREQMVERTTQELLRRRESAIATRGGNLDETRKRYTQGAEDMFRAALRRGAQQ